MTNVTTNRKSTIGISPWGSGDTPDAALAKLKKLAALILAKD